MSKRGFYSTMAVLLTILTVGVILDLRVDTNEPDTYKESGSKVTYINEEDLTKKAIDNKLARFKAERAIKLELKEGKKKIAE